MTTDMQREAREAARRAEGMLERATELYGKAPAYSYAFTFRGEIATPASIQSIVDGKPSFYQPSVTDQWNKLSPHAKEGSVNI